MKNCMSDVFHVFVRFQLELLAGLLAEVQR